MTTRLPDERGYVPVSDAAPLTALAYCTRCGAVVFSDVAGAIHDVWHTDLERVRENARWASTLRPIRGIR